ncbi:MAG: selenocysteine-specific translation elongation factor [Anaerolineales bacterium]|nr:selenocysteine-specific translation elongation factor [Anaerolineales bacterium]
MRVIGTAGHVDHGKSSLIQAMTGTHPDRLKEEQEREMTIDLGFAWWVSDAGETIGVVDVPGHRDFIENMLAGIGGIDAVLFVIAADEGVMPQTKEHLAIIDLLGISNGVIALTKIDLVHDPDWIGLVQAEIKEVFQGTVLENVPIIAVSSKTHVGLLTLKSELTKCLNSLRDRRDIHRPRLPIDRAFSIKGFGTVVTGTLQDGSLKVQDEIEILPEKIPGRVRGIQNHNQKLEEISTGSRTAVNLSGIDLNQVRRGQVLVKHNTYQPTRRIDVQFKGVGEASVSITHNSTVKFFMGSAEVSARVRLLGTERLSPGENYFLQLELEEPVVAVWGDKFIIRRPSPSDTLGGGKVLNPFPSKRYKRFDAEIIRKLAIISGGYEDDVLFELIDMSGIRSIKQISDLYGCRTSYLEKPLSSLEKSRRIRILGKLANPDCLVFTNNFIAQKREQLINELVFFHQQYPLRTGIIREKLIQKVRLSPNIYAFLENEMVNRHEIKVTGKLVARESHIIQYSLPQQAMIKRMIAQILKNEYSPPDPKEINEWIGNELYQSLIENGTLKQLSGEVVYLSDTYEKMKNRVTEMIQKAGGITVAEVRDEFNSSRKYILAFLEFLDSERITIRIENTRTLNPDLKDQAI